MYTLFLAPVGSGVGLTSIALGLVRALELAGLAVGFAKPISQSKQQYGQDRSTHFAKTLCHRKSADPVSLERANDLLRKGMMDQLMEDVIDMFARSSVGADVMIVEGLVQDPMQPFVADINAAMARDLQAEVIFVGEGSKNSSIQLAEQISLTAQSMGTSPNAVAGMIINRLPIEAEPIKLASDISKILPFKMPLLGAIPYTGTILFPRTSDVAKHLNADVLLEGEMASRRVRDIVVTARSAPKMVEFLKPGALIVCPTDRGDILMATALAASAGVPLAGLVLTSGDERVDRDIIELCRPAFLSGTPILSVPYLSFETARLLDQMSNKVPLDDLERMENIIEYIQERIDVSKITHKIGQPQESRLSPPLFRYQLIQKAKSANKRIVLPEGDEPRTVHAAIICHQKNIARCVLIAKRNDVERVASNQGLALPDDIEILDPDVVREQYVEHLVELRKNKGMTPPAALEQLQDNVMLGTVMLAIDEVDGLVSGAVHTTANTVRPALQIIKTAPGASIVSSVFFMLMPDQVLVYGDCAINPVPTADELADIAIQSADSALAFGIEPRVAMISYSTGTSGTGEDVEKVREATRIAIQKRSDLLIDGPMQYDAASVESVGLQKAPDSKVAGRATVFIFPDLNTGNTTYKAVQRSANVISVGPMLQGLRKPVNDLSRGALVEDIVYTIALTVIQADTQNKSA